MVSVRFDLAPGGVKLLQGNYSASKLLQTVPLADPLAALQILARNNFV